MFSKLQSSAAKCNGVQVHVRCSEVQVVKCEPCASAGKCSVITASAVKYKCSAVKYTLSAFKNRCSHV